MYQSRSPTGLQKDKGSIHVPYLLGIMLDTANMAIKLPQDDKQLRIKTSLTKSLRKKTATK